MKSQCKLIFLMPLLVILAACDREAGTTDPVQPGQLKIVELRERAREASGDDFSIQQYHNIVLGAAVVPLTILESIVDDYITSSQAE